MKGDFKAQIPGIMEEDFYVVVISYSGEGRFDTCEIAEKRLMTPRGIRYWDIFERARAGLMSAGLAEIESDAKFETLEQLANCAFENGMRTMAREHMQSSGYKPKKLDDIS